MFAMGKCEGREDWTIHGLWPDPHNFCGEEEFDMAQLDSILPEMKKHWPSCPEFHSSVNEFWGHEWSKHGTCSGMDQLTYFSTGLDMFSKYSGSCESGDQCQVCLDKDMSFDHEGNCGTFKKL